MRIFSCFLVSCFLVGPAAGAPLTLAPEVVVCVRPGGAEEAAARELARVMGRLTGRTVAVQLDAPTAGQAAVVVGRLALERSRPLRESLQRVAPPRRPCLSAQAVAWHAEGSQLLLAGNDETSTGFAVQALLQRWGCRWYFPNEFGECLPPRATLTVEGDFAYAPPFEVRSFWLSWNGDGTGHDEFARRNFFNQLRVPSGHALGAYLKEGADVSQPAVAEAVAQAALPLFSAGTSLSLSMEDASARAAGDRLKLHDKYFTCPVLSDVYLAFYNRVCAALLRAAPDSKARIGFLAYINLTLPPQQVLAAASPLVCYLAPIDFDPNHALNDARFPQLADLRGAMARWCQVMAGRVVLYDYDQGMLLWRDVPEPSHFVVAENVREWKRLGLLGVDTESRGALATTGLNLFFRGQLLWNPDLDVAAELKAFYVNFYGPAAGPMERYWSLIFEAWKTTRVTEHEFFVLPAVYPRALVERLRPLVVEAEGLLPSDNLRMRFTRLGFDVLDHYTAMLDAAGRCDYAAAVREGDAGLQSREALTALSGTFTTYKNMPESGAGFWPGEVDLYRELATSLKVTPLAQGWSVRLDPFDHGLWQNWAREAGSVGWTAVRPDLYLQAQLEVPQPVGFVWYRCRLPAVRGNNELHFPGLVGEAWLYLNGALLEHREQKPLMWMNDYKFSWTVPLPGDLSRGEHQLMLRVPVGEHLTGLVRTPFLRSATASSAR